MVALEKNIELGTLAGHTVEVCGLNNSRECTEFMVDGVGPLKSSELALEIRKELATRVESWNSHGPRIFGRQFQAAAVRTEEGTNRSGPRVTGVLGNRSLPEEARLKLVELCEGLKGESKKALEAWMSEYAPDPEVLKKQAQMKALEEQIKKAQEALAALQA